MKLQKIAFLFVLCGLLCLVGGQLKAGSETTLNEINSRIESAVLEGRNWPNWPGGVCGHFFWRSGRVSPKGTDEKPSQTGYGETTIIYRENGSWLEIGLAKNSDGYWTATEMHKSSFFRYTPVKWISRYFQFSRTARYGFDYQAQSPLFLLNYLTQKKTRIWLVGESSGWVKESDIPALINLLDSEEPCSSVMSFLSSTIDTTWSTVGNEAAYLIKGYREDRYPPGLVSQHHRWEKEEIQNWWNNRKGT